MKRPDGAALLELETAARHRGTGLNASVLLGRWRLRSVWPKGEIQASSFSGWALRGLQAELDLQSGEEEQLLLSNAVSIGPLELRFRGEASLRGRRPLLTFVFRTVELTVSGRCLLKREIPAPMPSRQPFFALIHRDPSGWLAARGRGGGLALWELAPAEN